VDFNANHSESKFKRVGCSIGAPEHVGVPQELAPVSPKVSWETGTWEVNPGTMHVLG
jgi:hypothetical protein